MDIGYSGSERIKWVCNGYSESVMDIVGLQWESGSVLDKLGLYWM